MKTAKTITPIRIWTWAYRPFMMGGSCNYILATDIAEIEVAFKCRGYSLVVVKDARGKFRVAERSTGALVSDPHADAALACDTVTRDIKSAKAAVMRGQVAEAKADFENAQRGHFLTIVSNEEFWAKMPAN